MNKKKKVLAVILSMSIFVCNLKQTSAIETEFNKNISIKNINESFKLDENLDEINSIIYKKSLKINNEEYKLYPTFDNSKTALENISIQAKNVLREIKSRYDLGEFSEFTWKEYYDKSLDYESYICDLYYSNSNESSKYKNLVDEISLLLEFFDIYENNEKNKEIIELVNNKNISSDYLLVNLSEKLPYNNKVAILKDKKYVDIKENMGLNNLDSSMSQDDSEEEVSEEYEYVEDTDDIYMINEGASSTASGSGYSQNYKFNIKEGVKYADKYAEEKSNIYKYINGADCTNFVSQIKRAGGVPRCIKYSGGNDIRINWSTSWHCIPKEDKYSTVWINANAFVRFFGVKYSTKSFISFADNVKKGSFVSFDRTDDGEFDHNGFVTHTIRKKGESRRKVKYLDTNLTYKDFKLAQHSNRYNEWTSVGKKNHWETLKQRFPKIKFVIVN